MDASGVASPTERLVVSRRIMQVVLSLAPGGTERLVVQLARALHSRHPMTVCCLDEPGEWSKEIERVGIPVVTIGRRPGFRPDVAKRIADVGAAHGIDLVHCHHYSPFIYATMSCWWRSVPVIFTEHGRTSDAPASRKRRLANQLFGRIPARIFAVSGDLKQHMVREGFDASRIGVIYNGIEREPSFDDGARARARAIIGAKPSDLVIGAVGRLDPVKNLGTLLEALRQLTDRFPSARVVFIGDGPTRESLVRQAGELNLGPHVAFLGYRSDVRALLPGLDVYANTSIFEGVSLTILEAMATGLPVVATRVGGTPEVVVDGESGLLVPTRDPGALAVALEGALGNPGLRTRLGASARSRVERLFLLDRMIADYASVYEETMVQSCVA
jgi:glycosyltransferase involved in cell wall biosynthesis